MKIFTIIAVAVILCLPLVACSNSDSASQSGQSCTTLVVLSDWKTKRVPITCCPPLDIGIKAIYGVPRVQVESVLGAPRDDISNAKSVYYKDGGIRVLYNEDDISASIVLAPEQLPFAPDAVLRFLGISTMTVSADVSPVDIQWENDPQFRYIGVDVDREQPGLVYQIYVR
ncbi:MAG: hypothetical protein LBV79_10865 [Candidatus Adiutrix sp.]|jgi:hypothetical protein|nr:hypothetical protein [Candidatus Adiutrix sp.]